MISIGLWSGVECFILIFLFIEIFILLIKHFLGSNPKRRRKKYMTKMMLKSIVEKIDIFSSNILLKIILFLLELGKASPQPKVQSI
jgi:hypothetical protein